MQSVPTESGFVESLREAFSVIANGEQREQLEGGRTTWQEVHTAMEDLDKVIHNFKGPVKIERALAKIDGFLGRVEGIAQPLLQANQSVAPVVWGAVRSILSVAKGRKEAVEATIDAFICIAESIPRICSVAASHGQLHSALGLNNAMSSAFAAIVRFLRDVTVYIKQKARWQLLTSKDFASKIVEARKKLVEQFRSVHYELCAEEFKRAESYRKDETFRTLLKRLNSVNYEAEKEFLRLYRMDDTCVWSKSDPLIGGWLSNDFDTLQTRRVWLHGTPGTGKSVLSAYLVDTAMDKVSPDEVVLYFFCNSNQDVSQKTYQSILRTLITQLLEVKTSYQKDYEKLADSVLKRGESYVFTPSNLEPHFHALVGSFSKTRIIIDGLDECNKDVMKAVVDLLDRLSESDYSTTKVLLSSRAEADVKDNLSSWPQVEIGLDGTTQDDMRRYIRMQSRRLISELSLDYPEDRLQEDILEAAGSMFLYVRLLVEDSIARKSYCSTDECIQSLFDLPRGLHDMYSRYLKTLAGRNDGRANQIGWRVLQWLVYSGGPMTLSLLNVLLAVSPRDVALDRRKLLNNVQSMLRTTLGVLVDCRESRDHRWGQWRASLVHRSFHDFLTSRGLDAHWQDTPELKDLRRSMQSYFAYLQLSTTCSIILCSPPVRLPWSEYLDALDIRRGEQSLSERRGVLRDHLGYHAEARRKDWKWWGLDWEGAELEDLTKSWDDRDRREKHAIQRLKAAELLDDRQREGVEQKVRALEDQRSRSQSSPEKRRSELRILETVLNLKEREAVVHSQQRLSSYLARASNHSTYRFSSAALMFMFCTFLKDALQAALVCARAMDSRQCRFPMEVLAFTNLANNLQEFEQMVTEVSRVVLNPEHIRSHSWLDTFASTTNQWSFFSQTMSGVGRMANRHLPYSSSDAVFKDDIIDAIRNVKASQQPRAKKLLLFSSRAIATFRAVESTLYKYDETLPVIVQTGRFVYNLQGAPQSLARWTVVELCSYLSEEQSHKLREHLHDVDFFHSNVLLPSENGYNATHEEPNHSPQRRGSIKHCVFILVAFLIGLVMQSISVSIFCLYTIVHLRSSGRIDSRPMKNAAPLWVYYTQPHALIFGALAIKYMRHLGFAMAVCTILLASGILCIESEEAIHHLGGWAAGNSSRANRNIVSCRLGFSRTGDLYIGWFTKYKILRLGGFIQASLKRSTLLEGMLPSSKLLQYILMLSLALASSISRSFGPVVDSTICCLVFRHAVVATVDPSGLLRAQISLEHLPRRFEMLFLHIESACTSFRNEMQKGNELVPDSMM